MKPDGNCFFRALSYQLFGTEDQHIIVRTMLYRTVALNKTIFEPHHMNETSIEDHLKAMASNAWATQVEVAAAASAFNVPVYYYKVENDQHEWNVMKPLTDKQQRPTVKCPPLPLMDEDITLLKPTHFELLYFHNSHYDAIVSVSTGQVCATPPPLCTSSSYIILE